MKPLVWCDVETTGLNPLNDMLLEVALIATDEELRIENEICRQLFCPNIVRLPVKILNMHGASPEGSGLLAVCEQCRRTPSELDLILEDWMEHYAGRPMAGSSVHFDRAFLSVHLAKTERQFHYRNFDMSTIRELLQLQKYSATPQHRARSDLMADIKQLRDIVDKLAHPEGSE